MRRSPPTSNGSGSRNRLHCAAPVPSSRRADAHDRSEAAKHPIARSVLEDMWRTGTGTLSTQVLQEFYVVATRKFHPHLPRRAARSIVAAYDVWSPVVVDVPLIVSASGLEERHRLSFWDSLVVEAARRAGAETLLTENLRSGRRFADLLVVNPFR